MMKPFDRKLHNKWDKKARFYSKRELEKYSQQKKNSVQVKDNPRATGVDLIVEKDGEVYFYVECEIKKALANGSFHYPDINLPERKKKFIGLSHPTLFMIFSPDGDYYFCIWSKWIERCNLVEVHNKYLKQGEYFFKIPMKWADNNIFDAMSRKWNDK